MRGTAIPFALALLAVAAADGFGQAGSKPVDIEAIRKAETALIGLIERSETAVVAVLVEPAAPEEAPKTAGPGDFFRDLKGVSQPGGRRDEADVAGTGIVIDREGSVLTLYVAVRPGSRHYVAAVDGKTYPAKLVAADPRSGLAVLKPEVKGDAGLPYLELGEAERLRKGRQLLLIGNAEAILNDGQPTASLGMVTNFAIKPGGQANLNNTPDDTRRSFRTTLHHYGTLIQTDARVGWSSPGGALVDLSGRLVGVATTLSSAAGHEEPARYAIPINKAMRRIVGLLKEGKEVEYGLLGIAFPVESAVSTRRLPGIEVQVAFPGGPASQAGLRARDLITHVADVPVTSADTLQLEIGMRAPGTATPVRFLRDGRPQLVSVTLAKQHPMKGQVVTAEPRSWQGLVVDYATALPRDELEAATAIGAIDRGGCVVVRSVEEGSVAWESGARPGKFITHVGSRRVRSPGDFWQAVNSQESPGLRFTSEKSEPAFP